MRPIDNQQVITLESATSGSAAKTSVAFRLCKAFKVQSTGTKDNNHIYLSLLLQRPELDISRVQAVIISGKPDPEVLKWAIAENRILITHDVRTIPPLALEWMNENRPIPGIFLVAYV